MKTFVSKLASGGHGNVCRHRLGRNRACSGVHRIVNPANVG